MGVDAVFERWSVSERRATLSRAIFHSLLPEFALYCTVLGDLREDCDRNDDEIILTDADIRLDECDGADRSFRYFRILNPPVLNEKVQKS